eukprot:1160114-Pelagomonas_calceolata.AAC.13
MSASVRQQPLCNAFGCNLPEACGSTAVLCHSLYTQRRRQTFNVRSRSRTRAPARKQTLHSVWLHPSWSPWPLGLRCESPMRVPARQQPVRCVWMHPAGGL